MASRMAADVGRRATQIAKAIKDGSTGTLREAATKAVAIHKSAIAGAVGGDMRMSGVGRSGARVGATSGIRAGNSPSAIVKATGPLHLVERDTLPHLISSRYAGSRSARARRALSAPRGRSAGGVFGPVLGRAIGGGRKAVLKMPDGEYRRYARHPGTKGKAPFAKGFQRARPVITRTMRKRTTEVIRRAM